MDYAELAAFLADHLATHVPGCATYRDAIAAALADALPAGTAADDSEPEPDSVR